MQYEFTMQDKSGNVITSGTGETYDGDLGNYENYKLPRVYAIKNIDENKEIYSDLLNHIGKKLRMESDQINGTFEISLNSEEIVLREVLE